MTDVRMVQIRREINYPAMLIPENVDELIKRMDSFDNRKVAVAARKETKQGEFKEGMILAVKKAIQTANQNDQHTVNSRGARDNRVPRVQSSDKSVARKW